MPLSITQVAADRSRIAMTRAQLHAALQDTRSLSEADRVEYRKVCREVQADTDLADDPSYKAMLEHLVKRVGRRRAYQAVFAPEKLLSSGVTHPLYNEEVAELVNTLGGKTDGKSVERIVDDKVVPEPPRLGLGTLPRNAFFARHALAVIFRELCVPEDREKLRREAEIALDGVSEEAAVLLGSLPGVDSSLLQRR